MIEELTRAVLTADLDEHGLRAGDIGTVVQVYSNARGYEVEFTTLDGSTYAVVSLYPDQIRQAQAQEIAHVRLAS